MRDIAETSLAKKHDDLDTHPYLVTVENGTLVLGAPADKEGRASILLKKHEPRDLISKKMPVKYDREADAPKFRHALDQIVPDQEIQKFLQRYYGYCLTGSIQEQVIMMKYGSGSNGKSVLMGLMNWILGDYAQNIPISSLMAQDRKSGSGATPDLARLPGARFVKSSEPETGERFSESLLKLVSGGEKMPVRHLNEGFFEFEPQFKLCISFNNKPIVRGADDGFWRRVLLVPFNQRFYNPGDPEYRPGDKPKNKNLLDELKEEGSGILNWMIDGYLMWRETGLAVPEKVRAATQEYRAESNHILQFLQGWCEFGAVYAGFEISAGRLYEAYTLWAKENAYEHYSKRKAGERFADAPGIVRERRSDTNYYLGVRLTAAAELSVQGTGPKANYGDSAID
jgi:putative DNA primase/helicase